MDDKENRLLVEKSMIVGVNRNTGITTDVVDKAIKHLHHYGTIVLLNNRHKLEVYEDVLKADGGVVYNNNYHCSVVSNLPIDLDTLEIDNSTILNRVKKRLSSEFSKPYIVKKYNSRYLGDIILISEGYIKDEEKQ